MYTQDDFVPRNFRQWMRDDGYMRLPCGDWSAVQFDVWSKLIIPDDSIIGDGCILGDDCIIGQRCKVGNHCVIGSHCMISLDCELGDGCMIGEHAQILPGCKLGQKCSIGLHAEIDNNVTLGDECIIYSLSTVKHNCSFGEGCIIGENCVIGCGCTFGYGCTLGAACKVEYSYHSDCGVRNAQYIRADDDEINTAAKAAYAFCDTKTGDIYMRIDNFDLDYMQYGSRWFGGIDRFHELAYAMKVERNLRADLLEFEKLARAEFEKYKRAAEEADERGSYYRYLQTLQKSGNHGSQRRDVASRRRQADERAM